MVDLVMSFSFLKTGLRPNWNVAERETGVSEVFIPTVAVDGPVLRVNATSAAEVAGMVIIRSEERRRVVSTWDKKIGT